MEDTIEFKQVRQFRLLGHFQQGHDYIAKLPEHLRYSTAVAVEASQLYLEQMHYRRATEYLENVPCTLFSCKLDGPFPTEILDEQSVLLWLIRSYVHAERYAEVESALQIAQIVYTHYCDVEGPDLYKFPAAQTCQKSKQKAKAVMNERRMLASSWVEACDERISDSRVEIEVMYRKIVSVAADQGFLDSQSMSQMVSARLQMVLSNLRMHGCISEAYSVIHALRITLDDAAQIQDMLEDYLSALHDSALEVELALTLLHLGTILLESSEDDGESDESSGYLARASAIFEQLNHGYGGLDIRFLHITVKLRDTNLQDSDFVEIEQLANDCFAVEYYTIGIYCLDLLIQRLPFPSSNGDRPLNLLKQLEQKVEEIGGELMKQFVFTSAALRSMTDQTEPGHTTESITRYLDKPNPEIGPRMRADLTFLRSILYKHQNNGRKELEDAQLAFKAYEVGHPYRLQSQAAMSLARAEDRAGWACSDKDEKRQLRARAYLRLEEWIKSDEAHKNFGPMRDKCLYLAQWEEQEAKHHGGGTEAMERAKGWAARAATVTDSQGPLIDAYLIMGEYSKAIDIGKQEYEKMIRSGESGSEVGDICIQISICMTEWVKKRKEDNKNSNDFTELSQEAVVWQLLAVEEYRESGKSNMILLNLVFLAQDVMYHEHITVEDKVTLLLNVLDHMIQAERFIDSIRQSIGSGNNSGTMLSLVEKRWHVGRTEHRGFYDTAVLVCLFLNDFAEAWLWLQKGKARALSDLFGLKAHIPQDLLNSVSKDQAAQAILAKEETCRQALLNASAERYLEAVAEVDAVRVTMREHELLAPILAIQEGVLNPALALEELKEGLLLSGVPPDRMKFVDWYVHNSGILLFVRDIAGNTTVRPVSLKIEVVEAWIWKNLVFLEGAEPPLGRKSAKFVLSKMIGLVEPLAELTAEDDLLVLSPCDALHRVPLHALTVEGRPLMERNLISYIPSASILQQCQLRAATVMPKPASMSFMGVYEEDALHAHIERQQIFESVSELASSLSGAVKLGPEVTKAAFISDASSAGWLHYHGHALFSHENVLQSGFALSNGVDIFSTGGQTDNGRDDLTVLDISRIPMENNRPFICAIACDSGTQEVGLGNDPLGIVSSLLFAGATSVLGCMWPIESKAGRAFSRHFYSVIPEFTRTVDDKKVINLAAALRAAIRKMRQEAETTRPFYWAPFTIQGAWFHVVH